MPDPRGQGLGGLPHLYSFQRSYFGPQVQSEQRTAPSVRIGTDHRNELRKRTYVSKELVKCGVIVDTLPHPGPGCYPCKSSVRG
jgi:hypothetical protein